MSTAIAPAQNPAALNNQARQLILSRAIERYQPIYSGTINPATNGPLTITPRNVGLLKKFVVRITGTVSNTDGANDLALTDLGIANVLAAQSGIVLTDFQGNQRINTSGWHLSQLNTLKHKKPYASGWALETDVIGGYAENYAVISAPAAIAHGANANVAVVYEVPLAYSDDDLRGSIFAGVTNAQMQLTLTFATAAQMFKAAGADSTFAVYKGTASATFTNVKVEVYQVYLDQLPVGQNGTVLPLMDLGTVYQLVTSSFNNIPNGNEFGISYANYRRFLSTFAIYNSDTSGDTGRAPGTDINYWALQSANFTNIWQKTPLIQALGTRQILGTDLPKGCYYFSSRKQPISTNNYGNMELIINANVATVNAMLYVGWEMFAQQNLLTQASSLS